METAVHTDAVSDTIFTSLDTLVILFIMPPYFYYLLYSFLIIAESLLLLIVLEIELKCQVETYISL